MCLSPLTSSHSPISETERPNSCRTFLYKTSVIKEDLPDPETPVTQVKAPVGIETVTFFKL